MMNIRISNSKEINHTLSNRIKTLQSMRAPTYNAHDDAFIWNIHPPTNQQSFDPFGILSPVVLPLKLFLQFFWRLKYG
ncbi:unnamed protein product [Dracunculus medinensis]|uniref:Ovule protein n=1 Tax=Dracunculus medinensis TaxID=318479 RepID=A0A0N4UR75_DRAME|nr:unnamed protein product [Dracunculus medinensis]